MTGFIRNNFEQALNGIVQHVCVKFVEFLFVGDAGETPTWQRRTINKIILRRAVQFYTQTADVN